METGDGRIQSKESNIVTNIIKGICQRGQIIRALINLAPKNIKKLLFQLILNKKHFGQDIMVV